MNIMKTKENNKRQILSDEELKEVVGGLVQSVNPSKATCGDIKNEKVCLANNRCYWELGKCLPIFRVKE